MPEGESPQENNRLINPEGIIHKTQSTIETISLQTKANVPLHETVSVKTKFADLAQKAKLDMLQQIDKFRYKSMFGDEGVEHFARFRRISREQGVSYKASHVYAFVDEHNRNEFLRFVSSTSDEDLEKFVKALDCLGLDAVFEYSFEAYSNGLFELAEDSEALNFAVELAPSEAMRFTIYYEERNVHKTLVELKRLMGDKQIYLTPELLDRFNAIKHYYGDDEYDFSDYYNLSVTEIAILLRIPPDGEIVRQLDSHPDVSIHPSLLPILEIFEEDGSLEQNLDLFIEGQGEYGARGIDVGSRFIQHFSNTEFEVNEQENVIALNMIKEAMEAAEKKYLFIILGSSQYQEIMGKIPESVSQITRYMNDHDMSIRQRELLMKCFLLKMERIDLSASRITKTQEIGKFISDQKNTQLVDQMLSVYGDSSYLILLRAIELVGQENAQVAKHVERLLDETGDNYELISNMNLFQTNWYEIFDGISEGRLFPKELFEILGDEDVMSALGGGGVLENSKSPFIYSVVTSDNPLDTAREIVTTFTETQRSYYERVFFFALNTNPEILFGGNITGVIGEVYLEEYGGKVSIEELTPNQLRSLSNRLDNLSDDRLKAMDSMDFGDLDDEIKQQMLYDKLKHVLTEELSQKQKESITGRNKSLVREGTVLKPGMRIHRSGAEYLQKILNSANLAGECIVRVNKTDSYPFFVDHTLLTERHFEKGDKPVDVFQQVTEMVRNSGVALVYTEPHESHSFVSETHYVEFAATSNSELTALIIADTNLHTKEYLDDIKIEIAENGFYVPIYNGEGNLLFTLEEYEAISERYNFDIPIDRWDGSLRVEDRLGSNPGGVYLIPEEDGPARFYIKHLGRDHVWNEWLANTLYRDFGVATADVKIVYADNRIAHASRWVNEDGLNIIGDLSDLKYGFIMDAWLANWDIPFAASNNTISIDDKGSVRIDNGGALLFSATGEPKDRKGGMRPFTHEVGELGDTLDKESYGLGMRTADIYSDLTHKEILVQCRKFKEVFTDEFIDKRIEQTQLSIEDRSFLKKRLKERRDYILEFYDID